MSALRCARACLQHALSRGSDNATGDGNSVYRRKWRRKSVDYRQAFLFHVPGIFPEGESRASERAECAKRAENIQIASMRK